MNDEIALRDILVAMLRRWRLLLAIALIVAVLLGGYRTVKALPTGGRDVEAEAAYARELETYNLNKDSMEQSLEQLNANLEQTTLYNETSLLMRVDPYNKHVCSLVFCVNVAEGDALGVAGAEVDGTEQLVLVDLASQVADRIAGRYVLALSNAPLDEVLAGIAPDSLQNRFLEEIVQVENAGNGAVTIEVCGTQELDATAAAKALYEYAVSRQADVAATTQAHTLSVLACNESVTVDSELALKQSENRGKTAEISAQIAEQTTALEGLVEPAMKTAGLGSAIKSGIKYGALGLIVGLVIGACLILCIVIFSDRPRSADQLAKAVKLRYLGSLEPQCIRKGLDGLADRLMGDKNPLDEKASLSLVAANLAEAAGGHGTVLLTGMLPVARLQAIADALDAACEGRFRFVAGGNVFVSAETVAKLQAADAAILLEERKTTVSDIMRETERLQAAGKPLVGFAFV